MATESNIPDGINQLTQDTALIEADLVGKEKGILGFAENMEIEEEAELIEAYSIGRSGEKGKTIVDVADNAKNHETDEEDTVMMINDCENRTGIMGFSRSVKNQETCDDTALIETDSIGNGSEIEKGIVGFGDDQERNGKKSRRNKRRRKGQNKGARTMENNVVLTSHLEEYRYEYGHHERRSYGAKFVYSRKEMEALRFVNVEVQKRKWVEMYCGLGPVVTKEYDGLVDGDHDHDHDHEEEKQPGVDFDPRQNFTKKVAGPGVHGEDCFGSQDNEVLEEEWREDDDDDDSDEDYSSIQRPAFYVSGEPDFDAGPAQDGLEYLRRVRWEAERVEKVTYAKIEKTKLKNQTVYMPNIPDIATCPEHLMPLKEWETAFLAYFSELRLALSRHEEVSAELQSVPNILEENCFPQILEQFVDNSTTDIINSGHSSIIHVSMQSSGNNQNDASINKVADANWPTLSTILGMDSVARVSMLKKRIKLAETMTSLSRYDCAWLFALCVAVDTPLNADTSAALRDLLRKCASLRAEKVELDDEVVMLNILATISGKYFGQSEN